MLESRGLLHTDGEIDFRLRGIQAACIHVYRRWVVFPHFASKREPCDPSGNDEPTRACSIGNPPHPHTQKDSVLSFVTSSLERFSCGKACMLPSEKFSVAMIATLESLYGNSTKGSHGNNMTSRKHMYHMAWADGEKSWSGYFSESPKGSYGNNLMILAKEGTFCSHHKDDSLFMLFPDVP
jgi:hypothetical protein